MVAKACLNIQWVILQTMFQVEDLKAAVINKSPAFKVLTVSQSTQNQYSPYLHTVFAMIHSELHTHLPYSLFDSELTVNYYKHF